MPPDADSNDIGSGASRSSRPSGSGKELWTAEFTRAVGQHIRYWRRRRKLTTQKLSDITEDLGQRIPPTVLTNLENQRRDYISVGELLLVAAALNVPPVLLIAPIGQTEHIEPLPELSASPWRTRGWLMGTRALNHDQFHLQQWNDATVAIKLYDAHRLLVRSYQEAARRLKELDDDRMDIFPDRPWPDESIARRTAFRSAVLGQLAAYLGHLREHRKTISDMGLVLPALPVDVEADLSRSPLD